MSSSNAVFRISWTFLHIERLGFTDERFSAFHSEIITGLSAAFEKARFIFSLERCPSTGRLHYQGHINLDTKLRLQEFVRRIQHLMPGVHASIDSNRGSKNAEFYAYDTTKTSFVSGPYADKGYIVPDYSWILEPRGWQTFPLELFLSPPCERLIYWFYETTGKSGKSNFCAFLERKHGILGLSLGTARDNYMLVAELPPARGYTFDVPRSQPKDFDWNDVMASLEKIKDGNFCSTKYKPRKHWCPVLPHLAVFANEPPKYGAMSLDRWRVYRVVITDGRNECVREN